MIKNIFTIFLLTSALILSISCKKKIKNVPGYRLHGATGSQLTTNEQIDYKALFCGRDTLTFTSFFAYDGSYNWPVSGLGDSDNGTAEAKKFISWLEGEDPTRNQNPQGQGMFVNGLQISPENSLKLNEELIFGQFYSYLATYNGFTPQFADGTSCGPLTIRFEVTVGPSVAQSSEDQDYGYSIQPQTANLVAKAMAESDVFVYHGHIWTTLDQGTTNPRISAPPDRNTGSIVSEIERFTNGRGRSKYGIFYFNMCHGESIEGVLYKAIEPKDPQTLPPIFISNRNYSDYGHFRDQLSPLANGILTKRPLSEIILMMTTDYSAIMGQKGQMNLTASFYDRYRDPGDAPPDENKVQAALSAYENTIEGYRPQSPFYAGGYPAAYENTLLVVYTPDGKYPDPVSYSLK